jgi:hypothetical protein
VETTQTALRVLKPSTRHSLVEPRSASLRLVSLGKDMKDV